MNAFVDTFTFIAWLNGRDNAHEVVSKTLEEFQGHLITSEWVLLELADALCTPNSRIVVSNFLKMIQSDELIEVVDFHRPYYESGLELYANRPDKHWSLTDCISFSIMIDRNIGLAFTMDHHFEQAGFQIAFRSS